MNDDDDVWADTDFDIHDTSFEEVPEGYNYSCCDKDGTSEGCENHMHVPTVAVTTKTARRE